MKITFNFSTGKQLTAEIVDFNSVEFAAQLNNPQTLFISIGNNGFQKHSLIDWSESPLDSEL